jgi:serine/threonine protein kinase
MFRSDEGFGYNRATSMAIEIGQQLGSYEITALLGKGGMGEVYRARDTRLNRDIAIKVLPDVFANDPERIALFHREAQSVAALNHPNIAAIYDLEEVDGAKFLVLELVEGDTLADVLQRGPLPVNETLNIASNRFASE